MWMFTDCRIGNKQILKQELTSQHNNRTSVLSKDLKGFEWARITHIWIIGCERSTRYPENAAYTLWLWKTFDS